MPFSGHGVVKSLECGLAWVGATLNPINSDAEGGATNHRQVQSGPSSRDSAAIFAGTDIEPKMKTVFYSPVAAIGLGHVLD